MDQFSTCHGVEIVIQGRYCKNYWRGGGGGGTALDDHPLPYSEGCCV